MTKNIRFGGGNVSIQKIFLYYLDIKNAVEEILAERESLITSCAGGTYIGGGGKIYDVSKPVERKVEMLSEPINRIVVTDSDGLEEVVFNPIEWMQVVDKTMEYFKSNNKTIRNLLCERFFEKKSLHSFCEKNFIDKNTYYRLLDEGLQFARECAIQLGLIKVF